MTCSPSSPSLFRWSRWLALAAGIGLLSACAHTPTAEPQIAASVTAVDAARAEGAPALAPLPFNAALTKLDQAKRLAQAGNTDNAVRLAEQAQADAQVARSQASAEKARRAVADMDANLQALRQEAQRTTPAAR